MTRFSRSQRLLAWTLAVALAAVGFHPAQAQAQSAVISGRVTSNTGLPLLGANVLIPELNISVATNEAGRYSITIPAERVRGQTATLRVRAVGRKPESRQIVIRPGTQTVDLTMAEDVNRLEAVVVTGTAGATVARNVPFAISQIDTSNMPVIAGNAVSQLQGKIAGANITSATGRPGSTPSVILRGATSINASGRGQGPLYVVDGLLVTSGAPDINPNDIESIEIVKGAAASSLYGSQGGGGVINITTKSGRSAKEGITFGFRSELGTSDIPHQFYISEQTFVPFDPSGRFYCANVTSGASTCARLIDMEAERRRVNDVPSSFSLPPQSFLYDAGIAANPQRYRMLNMFQANTFPRTYNQVEQATKSDLWQNSNLDLRGRVNNTGFFGSVGYARQKGAFEFLRGYERTSGRLNVDQLIGQKISVQASTAFLATREDGGNQEGGTGFFRLSRQPAFVDQHARDALGRLYIRSNPLNQGGQNFNPLYWLEQYQQNIEGMRFIGSTQATYAATGWLDVNGTFAYDRSNRKTSWLQDRGFRTTQEDPQTASGFIQMTDADVRSLNTSVGLTARPELLANLQSTFSTAVAYQSTRNTNFFGYGENVAVPELFTLDAVNTNKDISSGFEDVRTLSYRATLDMTYLDRYIFSVSARREGSSLFGAAQRWQTFPRVAGAWIASGEPWWPFAGVTLAKVRSAWGQSGQPPRFSAQYETFTIDRNSGALAPSTLGNSQLRPEVLSELELGADLELFNRYALNVTYANSKANDQILLVPAPTASGFPNQWRNAGELTNKTWEASLDIPLVNRGTTRWSTRLIYDRNRAVITRLDVPEYNTTGGAQGSESMFFVRQGERLGTIYGNAFVKSCNQLPGNFASQCGAAGSGAQFQPNDQGFIVWTGGYKPTEGITRNLWNTQLNAGGAPWGTRAVWGMPIRLRDSTGNVAQVPLGNATPDWHGAVSSNFSWRKLTAYGLLDGFFGRKVWNEGYHWALGDFMAGSADQGGKTVENAKPLGYYWRAGPGTGGSVGVGGLYNVLGPSNESVEDASYVKLREASLSYNVGPVAGQGNWTVGVVGRNLYTWTKYRGYDPEVGRSNGTQLANAALVGIDYFTFPNLRTVTLQLSTTF